MKLNEVLQKEDINVSHNGLTSLKELNLDKKIVGVFNCGYNKLTSLEGAPAEVAGNFYCDVNQLASLDGAPAKVGGSFYCDVNQLTSLEGAPIEIVDSFYCNHNKLTSLKGAPAKVGGFYCDINQLASLKGAPAEVGDSFNCGYNKLTSLEGAPAKVGGDFICPYNKLTSLKGIHKEINKIDGDFLAYGNDITHAVLGLLLIDGIKEIYLDNKAVAKILNKHLGKGKAGVLAAQQELIDADLEDYAEV